MELPKIDNSNLLDKVYLILKERIVRREFKPNQKISIPDLAAQLGVSRTPIRDALTRLETDGLIKTISKVGTFVNAIEIEGVLDVIDSRLMLELWVVEKLPMLPQAKLKAETDKLEELLNQASSSIQELPLDSYLKTDYNLQFHTTFMQLGNNKKNVEIYLSLMNYHFLAVEYSLFTKDMVMSAISQHLTILDSLKRKNFVAVREAIRLHLDDSKVRLVKRIEANGGQI